MSEHARKGAGPDRSDRDAAEERKRQRAVAKARREAVICSFHLAVWDRRIELTSDPTKHAAYVNAMAPGRMADDYLDDANAVCSKAPAPSPIVIGWFCPDLDSLAHECVHAALYIIESAGVVTHTHNDEPLAYTVGTLFRTLREGANRWAEREMQRKELHQNPP